MTAPTPCFRVTRADGEPLTDYPDLYYSPLVDGYHVGCVNTWTLGSTTQLFLEDGAVYCLFDCRNLEMFADHTVRFAIYEGSGVPDTDIFSMAEDGTISLRENAVGALFTLPLDESKADPAAAQAFVESTGLVWEPITDEELAAREQAAAGADTPGVPLRRELSVLHRGYHHHADGKPHGEGSGRGLLPHPGGPAPDGLCLHR